MPNLVRAFQDPQATYFDGRAFPGQTREQRRATAPRGDDKRRGIPAWPTVPVPHYAESAAARDAAAREALPRLAPQDKMYRRARASPVRPAEATAPDRVPPASGRRRNSAEQ